METTALNLAPACTGSQAFINGPIDPDILGAWVSAHASYAQIGAYSLFIGQVRSDNIDGQTVTGIEYTAYPEMAEPLLRQIGCEAARAHSLHCLHILHSLGNVPAGGISLLVMASAGHRQQARTGCHEAVERIKHELPVWGKEWFSGDFHAWKVNR